MMRITKLMVVGVLAGTLGLIGCGDSGSSTGGSGGTAGTGGTGGTGGGTLACGAGEAIDDSYVISEGSVLCDGLGVLEVPIGVVLAAKADAVDGETDVDVQVQFTIDAETVNILAPLVSEALVSEFSGEVDEVGGGAPVDVSGTVPCSVAFEMDTPVVVTTPSQTATWLAIDGSIVVEVVEMAFQISQPVPLPLSTKEPDPACVWVDVPSVTLSAPQ